MCNVIPSSLLFSMYSQSFRSYNTFSSCWSLNTSYTWMFLADVDFLDYAVRCLTIKSLHCWLDLLNNKCVLRNVFSLVLLFFEAGSYQAVERIVTCFPFMLLLAPATSKVPHLSSGAQHTEEPEFKEHYTMVSAVERSYDSCVINLRTNSNCLSYHFFLLHNLSVCWGMIFFFSLELSPNFEF